MPRRSLPIRQLPSRRWQARPAGVDPATFDTYEDAAEAIKDHIIDCINAVEGGHLEDSPDPSEFRVVEVR